MAEFASPFIRFALCLLAGKKIFARINYGVIARGHLPTAFSLSSASRARALPFSLALLLSLLARTKFFTTIISLRSPIRQAPRNSDHCHFREAITGNNPRMNEERACSGLNSLDIFPKSAASE